MSLKLLCCQYQSNRDFTSIIRAEMLLVSPEAWGYQYNYSPGVTIITPAVMLKLSLSSDVAINQWRSTGWGWSPWVLKRVFFLGGGWRVWTIRYCPFLGEGKSFSCRGGEAKQNSGSAPGNKIPSYATVISLHLRCYHYHSNRGHSEIKQALQLGKITRFGDSLA